MGGWIRTVRFRFTMLSIAIVVVANLLFSAVTLLIVRRVLLDDVRTHIRGNLVAATGIYDSYRQRIADALRLAALDDTLTADEPTDQALPLAAHLDTLRRETELDLLWWVDADGRVGYRAGAPGTAGGDTPSIPLIAQVARERRPLSGTILLPHSALAHERPALVPAPTTTGANESLALVAVVPVTHVAGGPSGLLFGARIMGRRHALVDDIRNRVFAGLGAATDGDNARVTLFQGPARISTTADGQGGSRALGTEMSAEVRAAVLGHGHVWSDRAFVIDRWFVTAYEPLRDPHGQVVGALGLGLPEAPLFQPQQHIITVVIAAVVVTTLASLILLFVVAQNVLLPITDITAMLARVAGGDLTARVKTRANGEIGVLVDAVNGMVDALSRRQQELDQALTRQLGRSEKLASIGRLAAGIAHEVNNPLTGVLTFASLLKRRPTLDAQDREDLDLILRETTRVRDIVKGLLEFARETASTKEPLDLNEVVRRTMSLLKSQKEFYKITVIENITDDLAKISGDKNQLQQVLLNLSLNACEAMPNGGELTIRTAQHAEQVTVTVADTGAGIKAEHMDRIFEPFFTTKPVGKGTGLGLSVSYGIVQQHNGTIEVESAEGRGSTFTLTFPTWAP